MVGKRKRIQGWMVGWQEVGSRECWLAEDRETYGMVSLFVEEHK